MFLRKLSPAPIPKSNEFLGSKLAFSGTTLYLKAISSSRRDCKLFLYIMELKKDGSSERRAGLFWLSPGARTK
jgi:hypothetical protein